MTIIYRQLNIRSAIHFPDVTFSSSSGIMPHILSQIGVLLS